MKKYLLFSWNDYEGMGGWNDFVGDFDSIEDAISHAPRTHDNFQVVNSDSGDIIIDPDKDPDISNTDNWYLICPVNELEKRKVKIEFEGENIFTEDKITYKVKTELSQDDLNKMFGNVKKLDTI